MLFIAYLFISIHIYIYILLTKYSHCLADQTILSEKCQQTNKYFTERIIFSEKIPLYRGIIPRFPSNYATKPRAFDLQILILLITALISRDLSCWSLLLSLLITFGRLRRPRWENRGLWRRWKQDEKKIRAPPAPQMVLKTWPVPWGFRMCA